MDKEKSSRDTNRLPKYGNRLVHHQQRQLTDQNVFNIDNRDFPSLFETGSKPEKHPLKCTASSYSEKLKLQVQDTSRHVHFEIPHCNKTKSGWHSNKQSSSFINDRSSNRSKINDEYEINNDGCRMDLQQASYSNPWKPKAQLSSVTSSGVQCNKKSAHVGNDFVTSEIRNKKSGCSSQECNVSGNQVTSLVCKSKNNSYVEKSVASPKTSRKTYSGLSTCVTNNNKKSESLQSGAYESPSKFVHLNTSKQNFNKQYRNTTNVNRLIDSRANEDKPSQNTLAGGARNKTNIQSTLPNSKMSKNTVKCENYKIGNQNEKAQSVEGSTEVKKKKKRKSKLKRQAALMTGKILVLSPEVHSKIVGQSSNLSVQKHQNILTNINDCQEYPELGSTEPKSNKENKRAAVVNFCTGIPAQGCLESDQNVTSSIILENTSVFNNMENASVKLNEMCDVSLEIPKDDKSIVHSNDRIMVSLFDVLSTAKPKKKESTKKDEPSDENNFPNKTIKKEIMRKVTSQIVNPLDSSRPTIKRGKEREQPKAKRPSRMRKLILMGRQQKKENISTKQNETEDTNALTVEEFLECNQKESFKLPADASFNDINDEIESNNFKIDQPPKLEQECDNLQHVDDACNEIETGEFVLKSCKENIENSEPNYSNCYPIYEDNLIDLPKEKKFLNLNLASNLSASERNSIEEQISISWLFDNLDCSKLNTMFENQDSALKNSTDLNATKTDLTEKDLTLTCADNVNCITEENIDIAMEQSCSSLLDNVQNSEDKIISNESKSIKIKNALSLVAAENIIPNKIKESSDLIKTLKCDSDLIHSLEEATNKYFGSSFSDQEKLKATKLLLHSRKFRLYCDHFLSKEIDETVFSLIDDLARFQDRLHQKDPVKAKIRRRLVYGIKEMKKHMKLKKLKCIIIATDIEDIKVEGGLNDAIEELKFLADTNHVPYIFSHRRYNLGKICRKSAPISCVGIFNYEGSEKNFKNLIQLRDDSKYDYSELTKKLASELTNDEIMKLFQAEKESLAVLCEVRENIFREKVYSTTKEYGIGDAPERSYTNGKLLNSNSALLTNTEKSLLTSFENFALWEKSNIHPSYEENATINVLKKYKVVKE